MNSVLLSSNMRQTRVFRKAEFDFSSVEKLCQEWQQGKLSNFDYLMQLNNLSGRSFNSLSQYPIFPWVLSDYCSKEIDLDNPESFRDLSKTMGALKRPESELSRYYRDTSEIDVHPYHFAIHYSSPAVVLHYLVRLEPYTQCHWRLNRGFDKPNRMFHSLQTTWETAGIMDLKELIPEFFYLKEFLINGNNIDFDKRTSGEPVGDVVLPLWSGNDSRQFIMLHRKALESAFVSSTINDWIDLIFGSKQRGKAAVDAYNVFKPKTYDDKVDFSAMDRALFLEIREFGQTPAQLFTRKHPLRSEFNNRSVYLEFVEKFTYGKLVVLPFPVGFLDPHGDERYRFLPPNHCRIASSDWLLSWGLDYGLITLQNSSTADILKFTNLHHGYVNCMVISSDGRKLLMGGSDAVISVWRLGFVDGMPRLFLIGILQGHITGVIHISLSEKFGYCVSVSEDHQVIVWDLNRFCPVGCIPKSIHNVTATCVEREFGDFLVCTSGGLFLYDCNFQFIASYIGGLTSISAVAICSSVSKMDILASNFIVTGHQDGAVAIWKVQYLGNTKPNSRAEAKDVDEKTWKIVLVRIFIQTEHVSPIISIRWCESLDRFWTGDVQGIVCEWSLLPHVAVDCCVEKLAQKLGLEVGLVRSNFPTCFVCRNKFKPSDLRAACKLCQVVFCIGCELSHCREPSHKSKRT
eukprot:TRINITY_DN2494_c0_g3_i1.p1 TRINITY_DN2494_c0_g3~~TRINITY_DN2494_c0_g3_i1.p1  ORF type:complete len:688 (+),score=124.16 TRINITY_DN2494_c0_g3_i1:997-3060(+)